MIRLRDVEDNSLITISQRVCKVRRTKKAIIVIPLGQKRGKTILRKGHDFRYGLNCSMWVELFEEPETIKEAKIIPMRPEAIYTNISGFIPTLKKISQIE